MKTVDCTCMHVHACTYYIHAQRHTHGRKLKEKQLFFRASKARKQNHSHEASVAA